MTYTSAEPTIRLLERVRDIVAKAQVVERRQIVVSGRALLSEIALEGDADWTQTGDSLLRAAHAGVVGILTEKECLPAAWVYDSDERFDTLTRPIDPPSVAVFAAITFKARDRGDGLVAFRSRVRDLARRLSIAPPALGVDGATLTVEAPSQSFLPDARPDDLSIVAIEFPLILTHDGEPASP